MKRVLAAAMLTVVGLSLSGCTLTPFGKGLPFEERYANIHKIAEQSDYKNIGEVVSETYDKGDGVIQDSWLQVQLKGNENFLRIKKKIYDIPGIGCNPLSEKTETDTINCGVYPVTLSLVQPHRADEVFALNIIDAYSGKKKITE